MPEHVHLLIGEPAKGNPSKVLQVLKQRVSLEYMHRSPVDRELVKHPRDWPWSSWSFYEGAGKGLIQIDIAGAKERITEKQSQNPHP
jgi:REP element-mobilizing transposase RayT